MNLPSIQSTAATQLPAATPAAGSTPVPPQQAAQRQQLIKSADVINAAQIFGANNQLVFVFDRDTHQPIMRVVDSKTNEVIMQLPPDYVLNLAAEAKAEEHRKQQESDLPG
jgi:uncharacterized FlaG/YvyC family protein